jgi:hypothetical protein
MGQFFTIHLDPETTVTFPASIEGIPFWCPLTRERTEGSSEYCDKSECPYHNVLMRRAENAPLIIPCAEVVKTLTVAVVPYYVKEVMIDLKASPIFGLLGFGKVKK